MGHEMPNYYILTRALGGITTLLGILGMLASVYLGVMFAKQWGIVLASGAGALGVLIGLITCAFGQFRFTQSDAAMRLLRIERKIGAK